MDGGKNYTPYNISIEKPHHNLKKGIFILTLLLIIFAIVILAISFVNQNKQIVWLPSYVPDGFTPEGAVQEQIVGNNKAYVSGYSHPSRGEFVFSQQANQNFICMKPDPNSLSFTDYKTFTVNNVEACGVTGFGRDRVYNWVVGSNRFTLKSKNLSITDEEFQKIASSLVLKKTATMRLK